MASINATNFAAALKVLYPSGLEELWYPEAPFVAWVPKTTNFEGASKQLNPLTTGIRGGRTFSDALNAKSANTLVKFNVTRVKDYVIGSIDNEVLMASASQKGGVASAVDTQIKSAMYEFGRSLAMSSWQNLGGARGVVGSISTVNLTLATITDVVNFEVGMEVELSETDGTSGSLQAGTATITAINRNTGVLTTDSNWTAQIAAADAGDYIFRVGDFGASCSGVLGWIPVTAPTAGDSFFGVDRSTDVARLAGSRVSASGSMESTILDAQAEASINGGKVDTLWLNSKRFAELVKSLHSKSTYERMTVASDKAKIGFNGIVVPGERGPITVLADPNCPYAYGLLTARDAWELSSLGGLPHFDESGGDKYLREASSDGKEFRLKAYYNLLCKKPVSNVLITW